MSAAPTIAYGRIAPWVNLLLPGGGLILVEALVSGVLIGLAFTLCANLALLAVLLFPDDFSRWDQALLIGLAGGSYVGAQLRLAGELARRRARARDQWRRRVHV
jgi:hypothetical protein